MTRRERPASLHHNQIDPPRLSTTSNHTAPVPQLLACWWTVNRRSFAWRAWTDPFALLITEVLLRQTRAYDAEPILLTLLATWPSAPALAAADPQSLEALLHPLGLGHQRSHQLIRLATELTLNQLGAIYSETSLQSLTGIGPYSAAMVAASAWNESTVAVDSNVARVLARVFGLQCQRGELRKSHLVKELATTFLPPFDFPKHASWALIDFGALVCTALYPKCTACPLTSTCIWFRSTSFNPADRAQSASLT